MARQTVDFGIDLGTTNSVMACATESGVVIVPNPETDAELTPSAVARDRRGQLYVGQAALDRAPLKPVTQFKRLMGTSNACTLGDGSSMTPEELSAEVLKVLAAGAELRFARRPEHVVITVPAMFLQPQCEATKRAAEIAGLNAVSLLQEPIAAATAYLNDMTCEGDYLVYDLGGGTFDVSVVRLRNREMVVVDHGGDNYLGGSDFDRAIAEWTSAQVRRTIGHDPVLSDTQRVGLLRACEDARKRLSIMKEAVIDIADFTLGLDWVMLDQRVLEDLLADPVSRTIRLTHERLDQARLRPADVAAMFLVGGPTKTPYIRRRLAEEIGIPCRSDLNPMTVVALGAGLHAGSLLLPKRSRKPAARGTATAVLDLEYEPVVQETETSIAGRVAEPAGFTGEIRFARAQGDWDTGWMKLQGGAFICDVLLSDDPVTEFNISLRDMSGRTWASDPERITISYGLAIARPLAPYKYGVALEGGAFGQVIDAHTPLPASGHETFRAAHTVLAGSDDRLRVYVLEGNSDVANDNLKVGVIEIRGASLERTLREGEEIDVRMHLDESRRLKVRVLVPRLDHEIGADISLVIEKPRIDDLRTSIAELSDQISNLAPTVASEDHLTVVEVIREMEQLEAELERPELIRDDDPERIAKKLADMRARFRLLSRRYGPQAAYKSAIAQIDAAQGLADRFGDSIGSARLEDMKRDADKCLRLEDEDGLKSIEDAATQIFWQHYPKTEECWAGLIEFLREHRDATTDPIPYHEYLKRAQECLANGDMEGVQTFAVRALKMLPETEAVRDRFHDAGLRR